MPRPTAVDYAALAEGSTTPEAVAAVLEMFAARYENLNTRMSGLVKYRNAMKALGASPALLAAAATPELSAARAVAAIPRTRELQDTPAVVPLRWQSADELVARIDAWARKRTKSVDGPTVCDLLVGMSARVGELDVLSVFTRKGVAWVSGMLKKKGLTEAMEYVSIVPAQLAVRALRKWQGLADDVREEAMKAANTFIRSLPAITAARGNTLQLLRSIGATLYAEHVGGTPAARLNSMSRALRHLPMVNSTAHYMAVVFPPQLFGQLSGTG